MLINGAPGSGKSTIAHRLAQTEPLDLALDVDVIKHSLGQWDTDAEAAGLHARRLALAMTGAQLEAGGDVFVGQFLARPEFVEQLEALAGHHRAEFIEFILMVDELTLRRRLDQRASRPERTEHRINASRVSPADVPRLVRVIHDVAERRPSAITVDASGDIDEAVRTISARLDRPTGAPRDRPGRP